MSRRLPRRPLSGPLPALSRRRLLAGLGAAALAAPFVLRGRTACAQTPAPVVFKTDPFRLGVASGDPDSQSVVLWTRLAPEPLVFGGGLPRGPVEVDWEIGLNPQMTRIMFRGTALARPETGYSVHALARGLLPGRHYWYRFRAGEAESRIGRTKTLPDRASSATRFQVAVASCQRIEHGHFTAWADIAKRELDLVLHLGDYIYEYALSADAIDARMGFDVPATLHRKLGTLADYRLRHALYKLDPHLADAHAAHPFVVSFDDHEVANNWVSDRVPKLDSAESLALRAAAFQAYYENMPVREALRPRGPDMLAYRAFEAGDLLRLSSLDTRQYRTLQPCGRAEKMHCPERFDAANDMLGPAQERWLLDQLGRDDTTWNLLGNQVMMMQCHTGEAALDIINTDKWDGYVAARERLFAGIAARKTRGLIVATGDIHSAYAGDLLRDFGDDKSAKLGAEFVATSISSGGDGGAARGASARIRGENRHIHFHHGRRGYTLLDFDRARCEASFRAVDKVTAPDGEVSTVGSFAVEAGKPGIA